MNFKILITIVVFLLSLTIFFFLTRKKRRLRKKIKKKIREDGSLNVAITASNIASGISKAKILYKNLIVKIHPDRFPDEKKFMATEIASRITKSKHNYNELIVLQIEVERFINENNKNT